MKPYAFVFMIGVAMQSHAESETFDKAGVGMLPPGWKAGVTREGKPAWAVAADASAPSASHALVQSGKGAFPWCVKDGASLADGPISISRTRTSPAPARSVCGPKPTASPRSTTSRGAISAERV